MCLASRFFNNFYYKLMVMVTVENKYTFVIIVILGLLIHNAKSGYKDPVYIQGSNMNLAEAQQFLREYDREASGMCYRVKQAQWSYSTNTTETNKRRMIEEQGLDSKLERLSWRRAASFSWPRLPELHTQRQLKMLITRGRSGLQDEEFNELHQIISEMKEIYSHATICPFHNSLTIYCEMPLEPDITRTLAHSREYDEQLHIWKAWRDAVGPPIRNKYIRYLQLANKAAKINGFHDAGQQERSVYEDDDFEEHVSEVWAMVAPLYRQLHTYVRHRLVERYGTHRIRPDGPIPAHLLGNLWAQNWRNLIDLALPFPNKQPVDVTSEMLRQGYTPTRMFEVAQEFFTSLGLKPLPPEFWHHSMLEKPNDRNVICRASAWDFCNHKDYRIKQCTDVTMEDLLTIHHEMAHIQYYLQYTDQPLLFRDGANPGFHEAFGDVVELSVITPRHLQKIGLLSNISDDFESKINFLLTMALEKIPYIAYAYIVDQWRWRMFSEEWSVEEMNWRWWDLRLRHQGLIPPVPRTEEDFDPAAKYHVAADMPYIRYFVSLILQFQLHEALCEAAGHIGPLHTCDIYRSREAGRLLSEILSMGASKSWSEVVHVMTRGRTDKLDARPLLEYFQPLIMWLRVKNKEERLIGWASTDQDSALFARWARESGSCIIPCLSLTIFLVITIIKLV